MSTKYIFQLLHWKVNYPIPLIAKNIFLSVGQTMKMCGGDSETQAHPSATDPLKPDPVRFSPHPVKI